MKKKTIFIFIGGLIALIFLLVVLFFDFHLTGEVIGDDKVYITNETTNETTELYCIYLADGRRACRILTNVTLNSGLLLNQTITIK